MSVELFAVVASGALGALMLLQLLLAMGLPLGAAAWGGRHRVLPVGLRWASAFALVVLGAAAWVVLARADMVSPGAGSRGIGSASWAFTALWCLNTLGNLASTSRIERAVMTPITILLALSFAIVARS